MSQHFIDERYALLRLAYINTAAVPIVSVSGCKDIGAYGRLQICPAIINKISHTHSYNKTILIFISRIKAKTFYKA